MTSNNWGNPLKTKKMKKNMRMNMDVQMFNESWDSDLIKPINLTSPILVCFDWKNCIEKVLQEGKNILVESKGVAHP